jgi:uncharacterized membrane protein required for colicin V production
MTIPISALPYFNFFIIGFIVVMLVYGFFRGFLLQIFSIVMFIAVCFVSWIIAPVLAKALPIMGSSEQFNVLPVIGPIFQLTINTIFWFIIIVFGLMVLSLFFKPVLKGIGKLPIVKTVNRILGLGLAAFKAFIVLILVSMLLSSGFFTNGQRFVNETALSQIKPVTEMALTAFTKQFDSTGIVSKIMTGQEFNADEVIVLDNWLVSKGVPTDIAPILSKVLRLEAISPADVSKLIAWMRENGISEADIQNFMDHAQ